MKYYEVRKNKNKVYLNEESIYNDRLDNNLIYDGDFPILDYFKLDIDEFYTVQFHKRDYSVTNENLVNAGFDFEFKNKTMKERFDWVLTDSDHRKDVRVINEIFYNKLKNGDTHYNICETCDAIFSEHPISMKRTGIFATKAIHKLGDISRDDGDYAIVTEADDENYYGQWLSGYGFVDVQFPKKSSRIIAGCAAVKLSDNS